MKTHSNPTKNQDSNFVVLRNEEEDLMKLIGEAMDDLEKEEEEEVRRKSQIEFIPKKETRRDSLMPLKRGHSENGMVPKKRREMNNITEEAVKRIYFQIESFKKANFNVRWRDCV